MKYQKFAKYQTYKHPYLSSSKLVTTKEGVSKTGCIVKLQDWEEDVEQAHHS